MSVTAVKTVKLRLRIGYSMKIHYLGTCSGTEPMAGMHHTSIVLETADSLYWLDAGENCAYSAYTSGLDVMKTRAIFISHPHVDHTGGFANLLSLFHKLVGAFGKRFLPKNSLKVFFPGLELFDAIKRITLGGSKKGSKLPFEIEENEICDGVIFEDENIRLTALHNLHLGEDRSKGFHSYSFLIEAEEKRIVYSGDVAASEELDPFVFEGCDYLIHETGHHKVGDVLNYAAKNKVCALRFTHHGRAIINDRPAAQTLVDSENGKFPLGAKICFDGMTEEI